MTAVSGRMIAKIQLDEMLISDSIRMEDGSARGFGVTRCYFCEKECKEKYQKDDKSCSYFDISDTDEIIWGSINRVHESRNIGTDD